MTRKGTPSTPPLPHTQTPQQAQNTEKTPFFTLPKEEKQHTSSTDRSLQDRDIKIKTKVKVKANDDEKGKGSFLDDFLGHFGKQDKKAIEVDPAKQERTNKAWARAQDLGIAAPTKKGYDIILPPPPNLDAGDCYDKLTHIMSSMLPHDTASALAFCKNYWACRSSVSVFDGGNYHFTMEAMLEEVNNRIGACKVELQKAEMRKMASYLDDCIHQRREDFKACLAYPEGLASRPAEAYKGVADLLLMWAAKGNVVSANRTLRDYLDRHAGDKSDHQVTQLQNLAKLLQQYRDENITHPFIKPVLDEMKAQLDKLCPVSTTIDFDALDAKVLALNVNQEIRQALSAISDAMKGVKVEGNDPDPNIGLLLGIRYLAHRQSDVLQLEDLSGAYYNARAYYEMPTYRSPEPERQAACKHLIDAMEAFVHAG